MATYTLRRSLSRNVPERELEMMQVRAISSGWYQPRFLWERSFGWEEHATFEGFCVYSGQGASQLAWQQRICGVPFDNIEHVEEVPGAHSGLGIDEADHGTALWFAERHFDGGKVALLEANEPFRLPGGEVTWLRSFWNQAANTSKCIFAARDEAILRAAGRGGTIAVDFRIVATNHPSLHTETYDKMGLPHHWEVLAGTL